MRNAVLTSKVEGTTTIISIVPEGSAVKTGDLVCELDASVLSDKETQQEILVEKAKAALAQATEDLKIQEAQNESNIEAALLKLKLAKIDLVKYQDGDLVQQKNTLDSQLTLADENLSRAQESYEYVQRLAKSGYKTQNDLESERIAVETQKINVELVRGSKKVLLEYTEGRTLAELDANVKEYGREIQRIESKSRAAIAQMDAAKRACELTYKVESQKHDRLLAQIKACKLYAPQDGQVVYANTRDGRAADQVLIEVGVGVRERQAIINLPDLDLMKVNAKVHESRISMMRPGLPATIKVDAYPDQIFHGIVDSVASVPSSTGGFGSTSKEYDAVVKITDEKERVNKLRPGLTASVEVLVERREDVLQIPVQANITIGAKQFVFVVNNKKVDLRPIKVGKTNANFIEILDGVAAGDEVVMNPHSHFKKEITDLETEQAKQPSTEVVATPESIPSIKPIEPAGKSISGQKPVDTKSIESTIPSERRPLDGEVRAPEAPSEGGGPPRGNWDPMARFNQMDKDQDGKVSKAEAEGRFAENFDNYDADTDGSVTKEEFQAGIAKFGGRGRGEPRPAESGGN